MHAVSRRTTALKRETTQSALRQIVRNTVKSLAGSDCGISNQINIMMLKIPRIPTTNIEPRKIMLLLLRSRYSGVPGFGKDRSDGIIIPSFVVKEMFMMLIEHPLIHPLAPFRRKEIFESLVFVVA